jgi:hypothetical protein
MTYSVLHDEPPALDQLSQDVPHAVADIVDKCLRRRARDRYTSALALRDALLAAAR